MHTTRVFFLYIYLHVCALPPSIRTVTKKQKYLSSFSAFTSCLPANCVCGAIYVILFLQLTFRFTLCIVHIVFITCNSSTYAFYTINFFFALLFQIPFVFISRNQQALFDLFFDLFLFFLSPAACYRCRSWRIYNK